MTRYDFHPVHQSNLSGMHIPKNKNILYDDKDDGNDDDDDDEMKLKLKNELMIHRI